MNNNCPAHERSYRPAMSAANSKVLEKVCISAVYFGALPPYFGLFLSSCAANPSIDFLIFTDQIAPDLPANVKFIPFSLEQFILTAEAKLGLRVCIDRPYKLCDFKPVYGNVLEDYFDGYDYWGHCDLDLIFGDLRECFERNNLSLYDKFLPLGHLCLYRNTTEVLNRYLLPTQSQVSYREAFCSPRNVAFDEVEGINSVYREYGFPVFEGREFADISSIYRRFRLALDDVNYDHQAFCWQDGRVLRYYVNAEGIIASDEFAYIHFKNRQFDKAYVNAFPGDSFFIGPNGFSTMHGCPSKCEIDNVNPFRGHPYEITELYVHKFKNLYRALNRRIKGLF